MVDIIVNESGPFFDGRADTAVKAFVDEVEEDVAQHGYNEVHIQLKKVLKYPTGYYQSHIQTERVSTGIAINDGGRIVYGPWLEGVGSRNYPVTRFKGYRTFRIIGQKLRREAPGIAKKLLTSKYIGRMN